MKKNMSDLMKYREKVECFAALESIAHKINERDADMRSHIVLSMFKVAAAEANVPEPPGGGAGAGRPRPGAPSTHQLCLLTAGQTSLLSLTQPVIYPALSYQSCHSDQQ